MSAQNFFDNLSDEIKAKLKDCKTDEEMKKVFADANIILDADVLEAISGGSSRASTSSNICRVYENTRCPRNERDCPPVRS